MTTDDLLGALLIVYLCVFLVAATVITITLAVWAVSALL